MAENNIPPDADKLLFAEDLVKYVIYRTPERTESECKISCTADVYRSNVFIGFNDCVKTIIEVLDISTDYLIFEEFILIKERQKVKEHFFTRYSNAYKAYSFGEGFNMKEFIKFCHHIATMANYFLNHGINPAPEIAIDVIKNSFPEGNLPEEFWRNLHETAEEYAGGRKQRKIDTPRSTSGTEYCYQTSSKNEENYAGSALHNISSTEHSNETSTIDEEEYSRAGNKDQEIHASSGTSNDKHSDGTSSINVEKCAGKKGEEIHASSDTSNAKHFDGTSSINEEKYAEASKRSKKIDTSGGTSSAEHSDRF